MRTSCQWGFREPAVATRPRSSSASSRTNGLAQDADAADADAADTNANAATPATPSDGGAASAPGGEGPAPAHSPGGKSGGAKAARGAVLRGVARPKADAD